MSLPITFDEFGRPYIILREQAQGQRVTGIEAIKVKILRYILLRANAFKNQGHILAGRAVANVMKTSLGPKGKSLGAVNIRIIFHVFVRHGQNIDKP